MPTARNDAAAAYEASLASRYIFCDENGDPQIDWESMMTSFGQSPNDAPQQAAKRSRHRAPPPDYKLSLFYQLYVTDSMNIMKEERPLFRYRFRVPIRAYYELLHDVEDQIRIKSEYFKRWQHAPLSQPKIPLELLVLGSLRMLGSSATLDQISEVTFVSKDTVDAFFREFCARHTRLRSSKRLSRCTPWAALLAAAARSMPRT
jgi:hypothetical protein